MTSLIFRLFSSSFLFLPKKKHFIFILRKLLLFWHSIQKIENKNIIQTYIIFIQDLKINENTLMLFLIDRKPFLIFFFVHWFHHVIYIKFMSLPKIFIAWNILDFEHEFKMPKKINW